MTNYRFNSLIFFTIYSTSFLFSVQKYSSELIEIKKVIPTILTDIVYATDKNFTKQVIYTSARCFLRKEVADALNEVQKDLAQKGIGIKIWDGYRPMSAQQKLWDVLADTYPNESERENYVSNPKKGGRHTRGTAVDLTLIDLKTGKELPMPTEFDDFTEKAWRNYENLPKEVKANRKLLQDAMAKHGFEGLPSEWWHFDYKNWKDCQPLDINFEQIH